MNLAWLSALNHIRHARRRAHVSADACDDDGDSLVERTAGDLPAPDQQAAMDRAWALSVVQGAIDDLQRWASDGTLDPDAFTVLRKNLIDGSNLRDVASEMGLPLTSCHRRLAKARMMLQQAIVERLQLAGDLRPGDDPTHAASVLLDSLRV